MNTQPAAPLPEPEPTWNQQTTHVRKALAYIRRRGRVTATELVEWDSRNGQRLFDWNDASAATEYRLHQARVFLNHFRAQFDKLRVRAFIHVRADAATQIDEDSYYTVEAISQHVGMRAQVVRDIMRRMESLAAELRMWELSDDERTALFARLRELMTNNAQRRAS